MAGGFPVGLQLAPSVDFTAAGTNYGTTLTTSTSTNTMGAYSQLVASTTQNTSWAQISLRNTSTSRSFLVDIAVGSAGNEIILINNLLFTVNATPQARMISILIPLTIPAGSRIAARAQASAVPTTCTLSMTLFPDAMGSNQNAGGSLQTYNANNATSLATNTIDPGATTNTKGAYTQLSAGSTNFRGFFLAVGPGSLTTNTTTLPLWALDIAFGGAGSEIVVVPDLILISTSTSASVTQILPSILGYFPIPIPSGVRVAARAQCSVNTATGRVLGVTFYGVV